MMQSLTVFRLKVLVAEAEQKQPSTKPTVDEIKARLRNLRNAAGTNVADTVSS